jgi:hypothetical protein
MKQKRLFNLVLTAAVGVILTAGNISRAQTPPSRAVVFSEVVKLSQAHQSDDVILGYLKNSGASFALSADEIIYLNNQGVSQKVIAALQSPAGAPPVSTAPVVPPPGTVPPPSGIPSPGAVPPPGAVPNADFNTFHDQLAPDGTWVDIPGYGPCWRPAILAANPDWRPYYDGGHWVYTEDGWYWQSDYPWGDITFHYGRWWLNPHYGWVWAPAYNWGPSWVSWRYGGGYMGWAPLPPEARFEVGVGLTFRGRVGVDLDFGLGAGLFTFVGYDHFWEHDFRHWVVPHDRIDFIFHATRLANDFRVVNGHFVNEGIGRNRIAELTHHDVRIERIAVRDHGFGADHGRVGFGRDDHRDGRDFGRDSHDGRDGRGFGGKP